MHVFRLVLLGLLLGLCSCQQVVLRVIDTPSNTPTNAALFVTGDFNHWDAADMNFRLSLGKDSAYYTTLPMGMGTTGFKFTRGDWTSVETDACGHTIGNRLADYFNAPDTMTVTVASWQDLGPTNCNHVVLRLKQLPQETPVGDYIYLASNYNDWRADDRDFRFTKMADGSYQLILEPREEDLEYKLTRGSWNAEAVDTEGEVIPNIIVKLGNEDTLDVDVKGWHDINAGDLQGPRTITVKVPSYTPSDADIYIVGNFNKWNPDDPEFKLRKVDAFTYSITLNKQKGPMFFKFTRGSWATEEYDFYGNRIENRKLRSAPGKLDLSIEAWRDLLNKRGSVDDLQGTDAPPPIPQQLSKPLAFGKQGGNKANTPTPNFDLDKAKMSQSLAELEQLRANVERLLQQPKLSNTQKAEGRRDLEAIEKEMMSLRQALSVTSIDFLKYADNKAVRVLTCKAQKLVKLKLRDDAPYNRTVHFRIEVPCEGRFLSYLISETPGKEVIDYTLPVNTLVYAIDKEKWTRKNRKERPILLVDEACNGAVFFAKNALYGQPIVP